MWKGDMAKVDLEQLLSEYRFFDQAIETYARSMTGENVAQLSKQRSAVLRKLLTQRLDNSSATLLQLRALLACLGNAPHDTELAGFVLEAARTHVEDLIAAMASRPSPDGGHAAREVAPSSCRWPDADRLNMFDASPDRIVILDLNYRYRYVNKAQTTFHGRLAEDFIDCPVWAMTSEALFERVTKPAFDRCFAGQATSCITAHPGRDPSVLHSGHLDPVLDAAGRVVGTLVVVRQVDALHVDSVVDRPAGRVGRSRKLMR